MAGFGKRRKGHNPDSRRHILYVGPYLQLLNMQGGGGRMKVKGDMSIGVEEQRLEGKWGEKRIAWSWGQRVQWGREGSMWTRGQTIRYRKGTVMKQEMYGNPCRRKPVAL